MRYGILGPVQAIRVAADGGTEPVPVRGAKLRALLAALALRAGSDVTVDTLAASVWDADAAGGGEPPRDPAAAVQALVGRLRRVLGAGAVESGPHGYRLAASYAEDVDAGRFEQLAADGAAALARGAHAEASALLREALALWRGEALEDLPDASGSAARTRLDARRTTAHERRLAADLAGGDAAGVLPELRGLVAAEPLHEPYRALLIRALSGSGRRAEALDAYEEARATLGDRLGVDPGPELRALHAELLAEDAAPPTPAPALPAASASPPQAPALRLRLSSFVGREPDLALVRKRIAEARLTTLTGPGGAGKTRMAEESVADPETAARFPDGTHLAELAPVEDPATLPAAVLDAVGRRDTVLRTSALSEQLALAAAEPHESLPRLLDYLSTRRRTLLVLDNCEHLVDAAAGLAETLLAGCPGLTILATSREPLGIPGESVVPVDPLPDEDGLRLFTDRAGAVRPGWQPDAGEQDAVREICRRLDGLPLAIELAAARLRILSPQQIAERLDDRFRLLTSGARTVLPRQQTLRAVVDWSWDLLSAAEQRLLARLSVFIGGFTLDAAEAVAEAADGGPAVLDTVAALVDKSLVVPVPGHDEPRYRLLETIREYAAGRLAEPGPAGADRAAVRDAHAAHCTRLVTALSSRFRSGEDQLAALRLLEAEIGNVRAALRHLVDSRDADGALELANGMAWLWMLRSYGDEAGAWYTEILTLAGWGPPPEYVDDEPALALAPESWMPKEPHPPLPFTIDADDPADVQRMDAALFLLMAAQDSDAVASWRRWVGRLSVDITKVALGHDYGTRFPGMMFVPMAMFLRGEFGGVASALDSQIERCRAAGRVWELGMLLTLRARLPAAEGHPPVDPEADGTEAMALFNRTGDRFGLAQAHSVLAESALHGSALDPYRNVPGDWARPVDPPRARRHIREAMRLSEELGARSELPGQYLQLANTYAVEDRLDDAHRLLIEALELCADLGVRDMSTMVRVVLADEERRRGNRARAWELFAEADAEKNLGTPPLFFAGWLASLHGRLLADEGRHAEAVAEHRIAMDSMSLPWLDGSPVWQVATAAVPALRGLGAPRRAALLMGAAESWRRGVPVNPVEAREWQEQWEALGAELGAEERDRAAAEGPALTREQAAEVLRPEPDA